MVKGNRLSPGQQPLRLAHSDANPFCAPSNRSYTQRVMRVRIPLNAPSRVHRLMARHSIETGLATYSLGRNPFNRQPSSPARATTLFAPRRRSPTRPPRSHRFDSCSPLHLCGGSSTVEHLIETRGFITQAQTLSLAQPNKPYTHEQRGFESR